MNADHATIDQEKTREVLNVFKHLLSTTEQGVSDETRLDALKRAQQELDQIVELARHRPKLPDVSRYISKVDVEGYDTVLGYIAKHRPQEIENMIDAVVDVVSLRRRCTELSNEKGYGFVGANACLAMREAGVLVVQAYPVEIIEEALSY